MRYIAVNHEITPSEITIKDNTQLGVIIHIEDSNGLILLQKRGAKARDEIGLLEDIGGKVEKTDKSFKEAIIRELKEEIGTEALIDISNSIGIMHVTKNLINWTFIIYYGEYKGGKLKIMEPDKCDGLFFMTYEEIMASSVVTKTCKFLIENVIKERKA